MPKVHLLLWLLFPGILASDGCALIATRPLQEYANAKAALEAASRANADQFAPELSRLAQEWMAIAEREYQLKNFQDASAYLVSARKYAEQAEYQSLLNPNNHPSPETAETRAVSNEAPQPESVDTGPVASSSSNSPESNLAQPAVNRVLMDEIARPLEPETFPKSEVSPIPIPSMR